MPRLPRLAALIALAFPLAPLLAAAQAAAPEYSARRQRLMSALGDGVLVAAGADEPKEDYLAFWQSPDLDYLTGFHEPGAKLVIVRQGAQQAEFLFVEDKNPAREVWTGNRLGPEKAGRATGTKPAGRSSSRVAISCDFQQQKSENCVAVRCR